MFFRLCPNVNITTRTIFVITELKWLWILYFLVLSLTTIKTIQHMVNMMSVFRENCQQALCERHATEIITSAVASATTFWHQLQGTSDARVSFQLQKLSWFSFAHHTMHSSLTQLRAESYDPRDWGRTQYVCGCSSVNVTVRAVVVSSVACWELQGSDHPGHASDDCTPPNNDCWHFTLLCDFAKTCMTFTCLTALQWGCSSTCSLLCSAGCCS